MKYKVGDLVKFIDDSGEIMRIYKIKDNKYRCQLYFFRPFILGDFLCEEKYLRRATLEDWEKFCGKNKIVFELHKEDFIKGNAKHYINFLTADWSEEDLKKLDKIKEQIK